MALATRCPHCKTTFRVAQDQLKLRGGIVRCGACHEIFDGNASLVDLDAKPAVEPEVTAEAPADEQEVPVYTIELDKTLDPLGILPEPEPENEPEPEPQPQAVPHEPHDEVVESTEEAEGFASGDSEFFEAETPVANTVADTTWHEPESATVEGGADEQAQVPVEPAFAAESTLAEPAFEAHAPQATGRVEPTFDLPVEEELVAAALPDHHDEPTLQAHADMAHHFAGTEHAPLPMRESAADTHVPPPAPAAKPARARLGNRRSKLSPTKIPPPKLRVPEIDEPDFVKRGRQQEQSGKRRRILMAVGSVVLALLLVAQAMTVLRNDLAARVPAMKPALAAVCAALRCRVELPARIDNLAIETGELQTLAPDTYVLTTLLHNQGGSAQAWPAIELALTDANDKPLVRRVFAPAEYLPHGVAATAGFGPHAEQPVKLYFKLDQLKPSGYHIAVFYP
ncbi:zinc-ribbon domain-containing protein [Massilia agilis]|uniref:Zinc-ribbon domain-containing protein n=1 Tax=Massilia agilis TaxID=1811226 RepID=A0ABT2DEY7_9BURK|nr:DUF3426 domain-containing protein [Massilia agilis]MCS0809786.1 zinc-ribbon domain-containing protein [Massilia agilis]